MDKAYYIAEKQELIYRVRKYNESGQFYMARVYQRRLDDIKQILKENF